MSSGFQLTELQLQFVELRPGVSLEACFWKRLLASAIFCSKVCGVLELRRGMMLPLAVDGSTHALGSPIIAMGRALIDQ